MSIPNSQTTPSPIHKSVSPFLFCKFICIISFRFHIWRMSHDSFPFSFSVWLTSVSMTISSNCKWHYFIFLTFKVSVTISMYIQVVSISIWMNKDAARLWVAFTQRLKVYLLPLDSLIFNDWEWRVLSIIHHWQKRIRSLFHRRALALPPPQHHPLITFPSDAEDTPASPVQTQGLLHPL